MENKNNNSDISKFDQFITCKDETLNITDKDTSILIKKHQDCISIGKSLIEENKYTSVNSYFKEAIETSMARMDLNVTYLKITENTIDFIKNKKKNEEANSILFSYGIIKNQESIVWNKYNKLERKDPSLKYESAVNYISIIFIFLAIFTYFKNRKTN